MLLSGQQQWELFVPRGNIPETPDVTTRCVETRTHACIGHPDDCVCTRIGQHGTVMVVHCLTIECKRASTAQGASLTFDAQTAAWRQGVCMHIINMGPP